MSAGRILVAEDDLGNSELVRAYLESEGYQVGVALDGIRALDMASSGEFDLLLLDGHMPLYGGVEVLQMLRKRTLPHPIKIIALSGDVGLELRDELMRNGVDGYITKPASMKALGEMVAKLLAIQSQRGREAPPHWEPLV